MKKFLSVLLTLVLLLGVFAMPSSAAIADEESVDYAVVDNGNPKTKLNLRSRASTSGKSYGLYYNGTPVIILEEMTKWSKVMVGNRVGYMMNKYLAFGSDAENVESAMPEVLVNNTASANWTVIRATPSTSGKIIDRFQNATNVTVMGTSGSWYHVDVDGVTGYMMKKYLSPIAGVKYALVNNPYRTQYLNLRSDADADSESIARFYNGTRVRLLSDVSEGWVEVSVGALTGYMDAQYLYFTNSTSAIRNGWLSKRVTTSTPGSRLNFRSEPSEDGTVLARYTRGTRMYVMGMVGDWYYVKCGSRFGYVARDFLK
ncbi:MAG: SH3 domain-containing protein [Eubacteriales bacterium]|nr:SH3 domain-containing protein [Eubacteriales bacterium]MDD3880638.1 SH3 domain-containing protein [Eubacteriales bacterium]MDD4513544.1 SH3 domain-containing protein [Eubacteriales bacterium]